MSTKPGYHRSGTEVVYSSADVGAEELEKAKTMSKASLVSSQQCLPPPDKYLETYEEHRIHQEQMAVDADFQRNDEMVYAAIGPPGTSGCENFSYHQHQISTFGTVIPRKNG